MTRSLRNAVYLCGPTVSEHPCPRCENRFVLVGMMAPPECDLAPCGWCAYDGPEGWGTAGFPHPGEPGTGWAS